ncbi:carboxymuconolactone decarboxylase family protein [Pseudoduganella sp. SL102]|uniref:carboxymuconolactone decarboxylase family protein n=1 Tax=Pseudoduganella sp. SL102 TaxID=2995154 RepID=UPI00248C53D7|nr:carboxymuconolactone decarboxylase family protein [Pseudoduganella sp. SL102]WBS01159.1 carboxymuconolactone decarboxylase family protein [Pseudoduganella sp. SL102]
MNHLARNNLAVAVTAILVAVSAPASAQTNLAPPAAPLKPPPAGATATGAPTSRAQQMFGDISPKLADLTDKVLFGDVWERPGLSKRDRSLVTVSALVAMNRPDQLRSHLRLARQNGLTEAELVEAITHLAFYSGWPNGVGAILIAKEVFKEP